MADTAVAIDTADIVAAAGDMAQAAADAANQYGVMTAGCALYSLMLATLGPDVVKDVIAAVDAAYAAVPGQSTDNTKGVPHGG